MTEREIIAAVRSYYSQDAVVIEQVPDATGADRRRRIDAIALGCWPSRGLYVHAIEAKSDKRDLVREVAQPAKADAVARYCDAFWIATPSGWGVDVPDAWGWYEIVDGHAVVRRKAAKIAADPLSRSFVMALARAMATQMASDAQLAAARDSGYRAGQAAAADDVREALRDLRQARDRQMQLELQMSGIDVAAMQQVRRIVANLTGNLGALNALRVNAAEVVRHANEIETLGKRVFATDVPADDD